MDAEQGGGAVTTVRAAVRAGGLLGGEQPLLVLLSGGRDSTCLLDLALALRGSGAVSALHVNYGLRKQADADERRCAALCQRLGVQLRLVRAQRPPPPASAAAAGEGGAGNVQAWAREL